MHTSVEGYKHPHSIAYTQLAVSEDAPLHYVDKLIPIPQRKELHDRLWKGLSHSGSCVSIKKAPMYQQGNTNVLYGDKVLLNFGSTCHMLGVAGSDTR